MSLKLWGTQLGIRLEPHLFLACFSVPHVDLPQGILIYGSSVNEISSLKHIFIFHVLVNANVFVHRRYSLIIFCVVCFSIFIH